MKFVDNIVKKITEKDDVPPEIGDQGASQDEANNDEQEKIDSLLAGAKENNENLELKSSIEKIQTKLEFLDEVKDTTSERLNEISEKIGELRSMIIGNEKKINDIDAMATKAADLVREVQPENLDKEVKKLEERIALFDSKMQNNQELYSNIMEEIKFLKDKMKLFMGSEELLNLSEEVKKDLRTIQKIKDIAETHSDKVEQIFVNVQKNFIEFQKFKGLIVDVEGTIKSMQKEITENRLKLSTVPSNEEINKLKEQTITNSKFVEKFSQRFDKSEKSINNFRELISRSFDVIKQNKDDILELRADYKQFNKNFEEMMQFMEQLSNKVSFSSNSEGVEELRDKVEDIEAKVKELVGLMLHFKKELSNAKAMTNEKQKKKICVPKIKSLDVSAKIKELQGIISNERARDIKKKKVEASKKNFNELEKDELYKKEIELDEELKNKTSWEKKNENDLKEAEQLKVKEDEGKKKRLKTAEEDKGTKEEKPEGKKSSILDRIKEKFNIEKIKGKSSEEPEGELEELKKRLEKINL